MSLSNVLVFDIETVPDVDGGRRLLGLDGMDDAEVAALMQRGRLQETGGASDFMKPHLQRVVAISALWRHPDQPAGIKLNSVGRPEDGEETLVRGFFQIIERHAPWLVSWNGAGFDLPVLHYRALLHGIPARRYWEQGRREAEFRYNNYLGRYHDRHLDLMDVLSGYQARNVARLQEVAVLLGLPGKLGMHGGEVWEHVRAGHLEAVRHYCEVDVLNTYLIYLRFELNRGGLDAQGYGEELALLEGYLRSRDDAHLREFLDLWDREGHG